MSSAFVVSTSELRLGESEIVTNVDILPPLNEPAGLGPNPQRSQASRENCPTLSNLKRLPRSPRPQVIVRQDPTAG